MSSKTAGQQQQGRRTPLALSGGKNSQQQQQQHHHHQNQNHSNKMYYNTNNYSTRNQESKDSNMNKNNNQAVKNQQQETKNTTQTITRQQDNKKVQQNGTKHVTVDNGNDVNKVVEQNGTTNGNSNGVAHKTDLKAAKQAGNKDNNEKDKTETVEEKQDKISKKVESVKDNEKKQNDTVDVTENSNKTNKDHKATPTPQTPSSDKNQNQRNQTTPSKTEKIQTSVKNSTSSKISESTSSTPTPTPGPTPTPSVAETETLEQSEIYEIKDDDDIEPLVVESSPAKNKNAKQANAPAATSTPGKMLSVKQNKIENSVGMEIRGTLDRKSAPRSYSDISGRRSIRTAEYTPGKYNSQFRESYRRINTELDIPDTTNSSMNVTVGSEIPNNSSFLSFSIFGRGRKRERTPPPMILPEKLQSAVELTTETTPPKRARLDVHGIFSAMSSPLTMLRTRFSKATLDTPSKGEQHSTKTDDIQDVSSVSIDEFEEEITENITVGVDVTDEITSSKKTSPVKEKLGSDKVGDEAGAAGLDIEGDIKITETPLIPAVGEPKTKQSNCSIM